jgi:hypothetical protein
LLSAAISGSLCNPFPLFFLLGILFFLGRLCSILDYFFLLRGPVLDEIFLLLAQGLDLVFASTGLLLFKGKS